MFGYLVGRGAGRSVTRRSKQMRIVDHVKGDEKVVNIGTEGAMYVDVLYNLCDSCRQ